MSVFTMSADQQKPPANAAAKGRRNPTLERLHAEFAVFRDFKPLAIGIHKALMARLPELDKQHIRSAMHNHTATTRYLKALTAGAPRLDLDGQAQGEVTAEQAEQAATELRDRLKQAAQKRKAESAKAAAEAREAQEEAARQAKLNALAERFKKH